MVAHDESSERMTTGSGVFLTFLANSLSYWLGPPKFHPISMASATAEAITAFEWPYIAAVNSPRKST